MGLSVPMSIYIARFAKYLQHRGLLAADYVRALPRMIASWINGPFTALGTDGFGKSERRSALQAHFKVDAASIADAARRLASSEVCR